LDAGQASGLADQFAVGPLAVAIEVLGRRAKRIEDVLAPNPRESLLSSITLLSTGEIFTGTAAPTVNF
jgi:hypothetical protein